jgi:hypothetical protein
MTIPAAARRSINEAQLRQYFNSWDPTWRWMLILGLRDMRANLARVGQLAADEMREEAWADEQYVYGPLALGITAAAVNEGTQHCEDLFALLNFLQDPTSFARRMADYSAGRVVRIADRLSRGSDAEVGSLFCVPPFGVIEAGLAGAQYRQDGLETVRTGLARLGVLVRQVVDFYRTYEFFHVQYKHGLKILFRPFGDMLPSATIEERKESVRAPLFALTNEPLSKSLQRPPAQQVLAFRGDPEMLPYLGELTANRDFMRIQMAGPPVDLDAVAAHSWVVSRLLRMAAANRLSLGQLDENGNQSFQLPGQNDREAVMVVIQPSAAIGLGDLKF